MEKNLNLKFQSLAAALATFTAPITAPELEALTTAGKTLTEDLPAKAVKVAELLKAGKIDADKAKEITLAIDAKRRHVYNDILYPIKNGVRKGNVTQISYGKTIQTRLFSAWEDRGMTEAMHAGICEAMKLRGGGKVETADPEELKKTCNTKEIDDMLIV